MGYNSWDNEFWDEAEYIDLSFVAESFPEEAIPSDLIDLIDSPESRLGFRPSYAVKVGSDAHAELETDGINLSAASRIVLGGSDWLVF